MKTQGFVFAAAVCAALAAGPGVAQEDAPKAGSARVAPRGAGAGSAIKAGSDTKGVTLDHGINLITPDEGYAGLHRRAIRKMLIANAPKKPAGPLANTGTHPQLTRPGADGGVVRNAVGIVVPGGAGAGGPRSGHTVPGFMAHAGIGASGTGTSVIGTSAIGARGTGAGRSSIPLGTSPKVNTGAINATSIGHIASGPSSIGGPAKDRSGINGTTLRPKH